MEQIRKFNLTTEKSPEGIIYSFSKETGTFLGFEVKDTGIPVDTVRLIGHNIRYTLNEFLEWVRQIKATLIELQQKITFDMFWDMYDDKERSSKKRSEKIWDNLPEEEQVKAYYHYPRYNRNRGNAEKKYCETYLRAEMWNN